MKILTKISLSLSVALLLLHSFLPHNHFNSQGQNSKESISEIVAQLSLFDCVLMALKSDRGEGHLENFQPSEDISIDINAIDFSSLVSTQTDFLQSICFEEDLLSSNSPPRYNYSKVSKGFLKRAKGRAPPQLMV
ncbi:MAG: hypothetical protein JXQ87_15775 [Bacteroidia bacterium]